jgi:2-iminobutanoate/2-iminopropanoate deaminase
VSKNIHPVGKKNPNLPFHPTVRAGDPIFGSEELAKDELGNICVGNIEEEKR